MAQISIDQDILIRLIEIQFKAHEEDCFEDGEFDVEYPGT